MSNWLKGYSCKGSLFSSQGSQTEPSSFSAPPSDMNTNVKAKRYLPCTSFLPYQPQSNISHNRISAVIKPSKHSYKGLVEISGGCAQKDLFPDI